MCSSKHGAIIINIVFLALGLLLLVIGVILQTHLEGNDGLMNGYASSPAALAIIFGASLLFTSLLALLGAFSRSGHILCICTCTLIVLITIEFIIVVAGFFTKSRVLSIRVDSMRSAESTYTERRVGDTTWDSVQLNLNCCGVDNYDEWFHYLGNSSLPDSCCVNYTVGCGSDAILTGNFYQTGCATAIEKWTNKQQIPAAILFTVTIFFQVLCVAFAIRYRRGLHLDYSMARCP